MHGFRGLLICVAVFVGVALVGCTQESSQDPAALEGVQWTLSTADDKTLTYEAAGPFELAGSSWTATGYNNGREAVVSPVEGSELTLEFGTDNTVSGAAGVNNFNGPFASDDTSIQIGPLMQTKMAGPVELMVEEQQYTAALQAATEWEVANDVLTLRDGGGAMQVVATKK